MQTNLSIDSPVLKPTAEQQSAIEQAKAGESFKILAYAGSGKTSTLKMVSQTLTQRKGIYLAFNKAISVAAQGSFPAHVDCRTFHSLAYRSVPRSLTDKLKHPRLSPKALAEHYSLMPIEVPRIIEGKRSQVILTPVRQASMISNAVSIFCSTNAAHPAGRHIELPDWLADADAKRLQEMLLPHVQRRWQETLDINHPAGIGHEIYLKSWALSNPVIPSDFILFDEAQDSDPLMLGILLKQTSSQVIYVGDPYQQIYQWRGAVNAMQQLPLPQTRLTRSFRFGDAIAKQANIILQQLGESDPLLPNPKVQSTIDLSVEMRVKNAVLCRTNARAMSLLMTGLLKGHQVALQADIDRLQRFVLAAEMLQQGRPSQEVPELAWFASWREVQEYCETHEGSDIKSLVKLVDEHGTRKLQQALHRIVPIQAADYVISTAHKAKGLEWDHVQIEDDFNFKIQNGIVQISDDELRLLYVAMTRAKNSLNMHYLQPLLGTMLANQNKKNVPEGT